VTERNEALQIRIEALVVSVIHLTGTLPKTLPNQRINQQLIDSVASIGANYQEACEGESAKDFVHKMMIAKKECRETEYWLRILSRINSTAITDKIQPLQNETKELIKIFSSIISKFN